MPIYSANRVSSVAQSFAVNENYDINDFGRIMYETMLNDQAIFEAVLISDLREATAIQEGTMTFNEAEEASDSKFKNMCDACAKGLETLWEKIKGAFAAARRKISELCARISSSFNAKFKKKVENDIEENGEITLETEVIFPESPSDISETVDNLMEEIDKNADKVIDLANKIAERNGITTEAAAVKNHINKVAGGANELAGKVKDKILSGCKRTKKIGKATLNKLNEILTKAGPMVKTINDTEKKIEKRIKTKIRDLRIAYRGSSPARKAKFDEIKASLRQYQANVTILCRAVIQSIMEILKNCRRGLSEALHRAGNSINPDKKNGRRSFTKHECAVIWMESDAEVDEVINTPKDDLPEPDVCSSGECDDTNDDTDIDIDTSDDKDDANDININIKIDN